MAHNSSDTEPQHRPVDRKRVVAIIGSGFGGSVVARRLAQANQALKEKLTIVLLERGRRFEPEDFPRAQLPEYLTTDESLQSSKRLPEFPRLSWAFDQGLWQIRDLGGLRVAMAAGYGGGSLIYAGVHLRPPDSVFNGWPALYRRQRLDPYYRLVEAMLDVRPAPPEQWTKTMRMNKVAGELERNKSFFLPPVAVTFGDPDASNDNGFGVHQSGCTGCGNCIIGCPCTSKNTLDRNYLAGIEELGVKVHPLCEAVEIQSTAGPHKFGVRYLDHLKGAREEVLSADYVFVCAGSVGSTELLFRSRAPLAKDWKTTGLGHLGERFFANGDAPGVIFDTKEEWHPSEGPTITTCFYHADGQHWFLLQDGTIPPTLHRALGFLQSPLWLGQNAFGKIAAAAKRRTDGRPDKGLRRLAETLCCVPRMSNALAAAARRQKPEASTQLISSLLPKSVRDLLAPIEPPGATLQGFIRDVDHGVVDRVAKSYAAQFRRWPLVGDLCARLVAAAIRRVGKGAEVTQATLEELVLRFSALATVRDSTSAPVLGVQSALELILGPPPTDNTAILLAMGPDALWTLDTKDNIRALTARGNTAMNIALYSAQEKLMRDVAASLGGELRTNPDWTLGKRPLTVHAQGGCSMSAEAKGVTDPEGLMVRGIDGLFVFDGSVFPESVGVNPSSTIAAVAERNIEIFIRETLGRHEPALERWTAATEESRRFPGFTARVEAKERQWSDGPGRVLDVVAASAPASASVPGLEWKEIMEGFIGNVGDSGFSMPPPEDLTAARFRAFERDGQRLSQHIRATLVARLPDLEQALFDRHQTVLNVSGDLQISWGDDRRRKRHSYRVTEGRLTIDVSAPRGVGSMKYELEGVSDETAPDRLRLVGLKQLREDPGLDLWKDLTTLYTIARHTTGADETTHAGIMYVPLLAFVGTQLPSMTVTGADISPAKKSLLLLRFVQNFFRGLDRIYTMGEL